MGRFAASVLLLARGITFAIPLLDELEALTSFFEDGAFQAPVIDRVIPLSEGSSAYAEVAGGEARGRLILVP
jgi:NADPH:quinone reductase-like Zn-dependent oxidoreductase